MPRFDQVAEFMGDNVLDEIRFLGGEQPMEKKFFRRRTTAPAVAEFADLEGWRLDAERRGKVGKHHGKARLQFPAHGLFDQSLPDFRI